MKLLLLLTLLFFLSGGEKLYADKLPEYQGIRIGMSREKTEEILKRFGNKLQLDPPAASYQNFLAENHTVKLCKAFYDTRLWRVKSQLWLQVKLAEGTPWLELGFRNGFLTEMILYPAAFGIDENYDLQALADYLKKIWQISFKSAEAKIALTPGKVTRNTKFRNGVIYCALAKWQGEKICVVFTDKRKIYLAKTLPVTRITPQAVYGCERCRIIGYSPVKKIPRGSRLPKPMGGVNEAGECRHCNGSGRDRWYKIYPPSYGLPSWKPTVVEYCFTCGKLDKPHTHPRPCGYCRKL